MKPFSTRSDKNLWLGAILIVLAFGPWTNRVAFADQPADSSAPRVEKIEPDPAAIERVRSGQATEARALWWGFDPRDATESLQAAIDSGARRVVIEPTGAPWIVGRTIHLRGDQELVLREGVELLAKQGAFKSKGECLLEAAKVANLKIIGPGATVRMRKADYHTDAYEPAEWRHALSIRSCRDVTVEGLTLKESGGDGIYLGTATRGVTNKNITIRDVVCDGNNRQGISVITAENLLIERCVLKNTGGTAPQAGIDFEPNGPDERLVDCVMRDCLSENNVGPDFAFYLRFLDATSPPVTIRLENCRARGSAIPLSLGVFSRDENGLLRGKIELVDCNLENAHGRGALIRGTAADGCRVELRDCRIRPGEDENGRATPIAVVPDFPMEGDYGNVLLDNVTIEGPLDREPLFLTPPGIGGRYANLSGTLHCVDGDRTKTIVIDGAWLDRQFPEQEDLRKVRPVELDVARLPARPEGERPAGGLRCRGGGDYLVVARRDQTVRLTLRAIPVGRYSEPARYTLRVLSPSGGEVKTVESADGQDASLRRFEFTAAEPGGYTVSVRPESSNFTLSLVECDAPWYFDLREHPLHLFSSPAVFAFTVPRGTEAFAFELRGSGAERVKATLLDSAGNTVRVEDNIGDGRVICIPLDAPAAEDQVWTIRLDRPTEGVLEDVSLRAVGVIPALAW